MPRLQPQRSPTDPGRIYSSDDSLFKAKDGREIENGKRHKKPLGNPALAFFSGIPKSPKTFKCFILHTASCLSFVNNSRVHLKPATSPGSTQLPSHLHFPIHSQDCCNLSIDGQTFIRLYISIKMRFRAPVVFTSSKR